MDIDLFHIDYGRLVEVLVSVVIFSFFIERALSVIFESRRFIEWTEGREEIPAVKDEEGNLLEQFKPLIRRKKGVREVIAVTASVSFCFWQEFDAVTIILQSSKNAEAPGMLITGLIVAGGSKASVGLFKDLLGFMSSAEKARKEARNQH